MSKIPNWYDELKAAVKVVFSIVERLIDTAETEDAELLKIRKSVSYRSVGYELKEMSAQVVTSTDAAKKDVKTKKTFKQSLVGDEVTFFGLLCWFISYSKVDNEEAIPSAVATLREKHHSEPNDEFQGCRLDKLLATLIRADLNRRITNRRKTLETRQTAKMRILAQAETIDTQSEKIDAMSSTLKTTRKMFLKMGKVHWGRRLFLSVRSHLTEGRIRDLLGGWQSFLILYFGVRFELSIHNFGIPKRKFLKS